MAFVSLYSIFKSRSFISVFFSRVNGFLAKINEEVESALKSFLMCFTNLCASVPTNVIFSEESSQNMPDITGRNSSFPQAKSVLFIAFTKVNELIVALEEELNIGVLGNSAAFCPESL